jgi:hypothetical protein
LWDVDVWSDLASNLMLMAHACRKSLLMAASGSSHHVGHQVESV